MAATVLIVDDEPGIVDLLTAWMELAGYEACTASNGYEGLRQLYQHRPDLVISDVMMPGMDGYEFCHLVRQACDVSIMLITGVEQEEDKVKRLSRDIDSYMMKPFRMQEFLSQVEALLQRRNAIQESQVRGPAPHVDVGP